MSDRQAPLRRDTTTAVTTSASEFMTARDQHLKALPCFRQELVRASVSLVRTVPGHLDVPPSGSAPMLYSVSPRLKLRMVVEPQLKLQYADPDPLRGEKVSELVHEDEHTEHEGERQKSD